MQLPSAIAHRPGTCNLCPSGKGAYIEELSLHRSAPDTDKVASRPRKAPVRPPVEDNL